MNGIGARFKELRVALKCNQKNFAEGVGISRTHLSGIENGKDNPSLPLIKLICLKFDVNEEWLVHGKKHMFFRDNSFDVFSDEGLNTKYRIMKGFFEKYISKQTNENLYNIVQSYGNFVSFISASGLNSDNQAIYLKSIFNIMNILEIISYKSYMLKNVSKNNYQLLLKYKTTVEQAIDSIEKNTKNALSCYLTQYEKDLSL